MPRAKRNDAGAENNVGAENNIEAGNEVKQKNRAERNDKTGDDNSASASGTDTGKRIRREVIVLCLKNKCGATRIRRPHRRQQRRKRRAPNRLSVRCGPPLKASKQEC